MSTSVRKWTLSILFIALASAGAAVWWYYHNLPDPMRGFASGNGRIEATEIDVATKLAGRISEVLVQEGEMVEIGQVLARMDTRSLDAQLNQAKAQVKQVQDALISAGALVTQRQAELAFADKEYQRSSNLLAKGYITREKADSDETSLNTAKAALISAKAQTVEARSAIEASIAAQEQVKSELDDTVLVATKSGRILYRLVEPGEVLSAGGKVLTLLNINDIYMNIYLPSNQAGQVAIGAEARIMLDALSDRPIPATVSFVSPQSQFTPREVETRTEREKLMFRVKVRIDPELIKGHESAVKTGLPGVAWVQLDANTEWPESLSNNLVTK